MPRYFMQDTPLANLEREMMTPSRYSPRASRTVLPPAKITVEAEWHGKKGAMALTARCVKKAEGGV